MNETWMSTIDESQRRRFESAWIQGRPESIERFLPGVEDMRYLATLKELVLIEMEFRWKRFQHAPATPSGDATTVDRPPPLEAYLARFPQLQQPEILLQLVKQEYLVRHQYGDRPSCGDYAQRFPTVIRSGDELKKPQFDRDASLAKADSKLAPGQQFDRYHLRELHGLGGFGEVWRADDPKLGREIAVKLLKERLASHREHRRRFENEARIAARLEHPGIVPVYELGQLGEEDPYYTMKLVRGETLAQAIRRFHSQADPHRANPLGQLKLLGAFLAVARTMEYAHARGVVHRDLKPQNIILGDYGETIILDWGLAKSIHDDADSGPAGDSGEVPGDSEATQLGTVKGTPAYMAPEQAAGRVDHVNEQTDIYALGAILYQLLTGRLPFEENTTDDMLRRIMHDHPRPPRAVDPRIPPALEAICQKAMAKQPSDRYRSASELTRDLEHYLADEPVSAYAEPWTSTARRWTARHRTFVTTATTVALVAIIGLSTATVLLTRAQQVALKNAAEAQANFRLAREAVDKYFTRVSEDPRLRSEGVEKLRHDLLKAAGDFYQAFVHQAPEDPQLQAEQARSFWRLATITDQIGSKPEAIELYQHALRIFRRLARDYPNTTEYQGGLATTHGYLANMYRAAGRSTEAEENHNTALEIWERLLNHTPQQPDFQHGLAMSQADRGDFFATVGRFNDAEAALGRAVALLKALAQQFPEAAEYHRDLAQVYATRGTMFGREHEFEKAKDDFQASVNIAHRLALEHPGDPQYLQQEAKGRNNLGVTFRLANAVEQSKKSYQEAIAIWEQLAQKHADVTGYQDELALALNNLGALEIELADFDGAEKALQQSFTIRKQLTELHPTVTKFENEMVRSQMNLASLFSKNGRPARALPLFQEVVKGWQRLSDKYPDILEYRVNLAGGLQLLGNALVTNDRIDEAESAYRAALELRRRLAQDQPDILEHQNLLAANHHSLGLLLKQVARHEDAKSELIEAVRFWSALRKSDSDPNLLLDESEAREALGDLYRDEGALDQALESYTQSISALEELHRDRENDDSVRQRLSNSRSRRGQILSLLERHDEALGEFDRVFELRPATGLARFRLQRAIVFARGGSYVKATDEATSVLSTDSDPDLLLEAARVFAQASAAVARDDRLTADEMREAVEACSRQAIATIEQAIAAGRLNDASDIEAVRNDPDLAPLRPRADFRAILERVPPESRHQTGDQCCSHSSTPRLGHALLAMLM